MKIFQRVLRFLFLLAGFAAGLATAVAYFFARRMISPPRQRLWATPEDVGLPFETIHFPAQDGLRLTGWFVPAGDEDQPRKTALLVHGWPWNRLGEGAEDFLAAMDGSQPIDLLRLALALHKENYNVFMFDLRNHGESASMPPVTFGMQEARDVLGALSYLATRDDVDANNIGVVGFSMGANAVLYALPHTKQMRAIVAVQPTSAGVFSRRYAAYVAGPLAGLILPIAEFFYRSAGGLQLDSIRPASAASSAGDVPILYVQGEGDAWGSVEDVQQMAAVTPQASGPVVVDGTHRFDGYQHVVDHPDFVTTFFAQHLES